MSECLNKIIEIKNASVSFKQKKKTIEAIKDVNLTVYEGEIVGELDPKQTTQEELGLYMAGAKRDEVRNG